MSTLRPAPCRSCKALVYWVVTESGKNMPVDAIPHPDGNIIFIDRLAHVLKADEQPPEGAKRWKSHFATCVNASSHRKKKGVASHED